MTKERFIEVRGLTKSFGARAWGERGARLNRVERSGPVKAVDAVSLGLVSSARLAVLGPSGCGKTTLLRLIAGLEVPDAGEVLIRGKVVSRPGWALQPGWRGLGFVFQEPALWPHMTVAGNVLFGLHGLSRDVSRGRLGELMDLIGLQGLESRYPHQLSGGEARRVALARTLAPRPHCLLFDEPLTNLDPESKARMLDLIDRAAQLSGAAILYVTHERSEAEELGASVVWMEAGRLEQPSGEP
ncbi:MAG: ATP-binding cassette domain-containing protein [Actinobacteria bacterium]|nr:ATP-binding cassette domain-containing protein [Actinomycetota bacterium]